MVREGGLEPPHLTAHAPQTCVSTIPPSAHLKLDRFQINYNRRPQSIVSSVPDRQDTKKL